MDLPLALDILQFGHLLHIVIHDEVALAPRSKTEEGAGGLCRESRAYVGEEEATTAEETLDIDGRSCRKYLI